MKIKSLKLAFYSSIILWVLIFSTFSVPQTFASEIVTPTQDIDFNKDLTFIQQTLLENHPGICNSLDPKFLEEMEKNLKVAQQKLFGTKEVKEKTKIMRELGQSFHDAHLWIRYDLNKSETPIASNETRRLGVQKLKEGTICINIPTFHPSKDQMNELKQIIELLPEFRKQTVIFDLRGNSGGNSSWGEELLKALFGEQYVNQQLAKSSQNVYAEWRVSRGNLDHVKELIRVVKEQFGDNHPAMHSIKNIFQGMEIAFLLGENYYSEPPNQDQAASSSNAVNFFSGRMIAIIDKGCGSACLDFIDGLKAMNTPIVFIGEPTGVDSVYMELRKVSLPSGKGTLGFPIKVYRNRPRGHNVPHIPDIQYSGNLQSTTELHDFILKNL